MEILVKDSDYYTVSYDDELQLGKIVWYGSPDEKDYKKPFQLLGELCNKKPLKYFLSDVRKQGAISPELRNWFKREMLPEAIKLNLFKAAVIYKESPSKEYYLNNIMPVARKLGINLVFFKNYKDAMAWFKE